MVDVVLPLNSSIILEPAETVAFRLQHDTEPKVLLSIHNASEDSPVAFKVKTRRPDSYLVCPHQGLLEPNGSTSIVLILRQKDCNELLQLDAKERQIINDRFLVQSIQMDQSFYERAKRKTSKDMADELTRMWAQVDRQSISSKQLECRLYRNMEEELQQLSRTRDDPPDTTNGVSIRGSSRRVIDSRKGDREVIVLRKRYNELMALVEQLTVRRDTLAGDLALIEQQLQQVTMDALQVRGALGGTNESIRLRGP
ncbi:hypothetical protein F441_21302 [Phytophthora nicotianae CJ01A1]|nr:hypothetical protein L914_20574 [Phytophthora nicotianae]ETO60346.1 hypothetical protein F444_21429 [Phytophthora nicotianae P1976]ETP01452.1 hypothetical protein F441_21302 [Phytophthora nicotianae CJ01A1]